MTDAELWERFRAVAAESGEAREGAWAALLAALEPELLAMARRQPVGRLRRSEDTPREIVTRVFARLHARDRAAVTKLCAFDPPPELRAWLRVLVRRSAIDFMRASPEFERTSDRWISLATLTSAAPAPDPTSLARDRDLVATTVREMVDRTTAEVAARGDDAFAHLALEWRLARIHVRRIAQRGAQYLAVLGALLAGHNHTEIAERMSLTRREVELTIQYLEELLHARFVRS